VTPVETSPKARLGLSLATRSEAARGQGAGPPLVPARPWELHPLDRSAPLDFGAEYRSERVHVRVP
jgi:hypothetical protein